MNPRRVLITLAAFLLVGAVAVGLSLVTPVAKPAETPVELPRITRLTCLPSGDVFAYAPGGLQGRTADGESELFELTETAGRFDEQTGPLVLSAESLAVAGVFSATPVRSYAPCLPAASAGMILVTDPSNTELIITNSDAGEAVVDLALLGPDGEVAAVGARGIAVAPGVTRTVALSVLSPQGPVGVLYSASQGRVAMAAVNVEGRDVRYIGPTRSATEHLIAGIAAEAASTQLVVTNPYEERLDVTVSALGGASEYELAPTAELSVEALSTVAVDLGDALGGEPAALRVRAAQEIGAAVVLTGPTGSPVTLTAAEPAHELAAMALGSVLQVSNPGSSEASARVGEQSVILAPGTTQTLPLEGGLEAPRPVVLEADGPVVAAVVSADQPGLIVTPLGIIADDPQAARVAELDPHLR